MLCEKNANLGTQYYYNSYNSKTVLADYDAIRKVMIILYDYCKQNNYRLAIPKIGAGKALGDWNIIEAIIEDVFHDQEIIVFVFP